METNQPDPRQRGFTLIEVMIVVAILGLLATIVATNSMRQWERSRVEKARADVGQIHGAVKLFYIQEHRLPSLQDLIDPPPMLEGYQGLPRDPWKNPYQILRRQAGSWEVLSWGRDGTEGTPDDISSLSLRSKQH